MSKYNLDAINEEIMENINLVLDPCAIANGTTSRNDIKTSINDIAVVNGLLPLDKLRFVRTLSKGATEVESIKDDATKLTLPKLALKQAKTLASFKKAIKEGKKEFLFNGTMYQYREDITIDLSECEGEEAEKWIAKKAELATIEKKIAALREDMKDVKSTMEACENKYIADNPDCDKIKKDVKPSIVVL